jgi:hypothetical protein
LLTEKKKKKKQKDAANKHMNILNVTRFNRMDGITWLVSHLKFNDIDSSR